MEEAASRLKTLLDKWEKQGVTKKELRRIVIKRKSLFLGSGSAQETSAGSIIGKASFKFSFLGGVFLASLFALYMAGLHTKTGIARAWILWNGGDVYTEKCAVWMPDSLLKAVRPPEDCSMCKEVKQVDRVKSITPQEFEEKYAYTGKPVVVTDAMEGWTAPSVFSFPFFKDLYSGSSAGAQETCQFFPYETEFDSLLQAFNMSEDRANLKHGAKPWYIGWSNCDDKIARTLRKHYQRPYFLPVTAENKNIDWIFMGSPGYGAKMHVDNVNNPSWQAQLVGAKKWNLEPPPECIYSCQPLEITVNAGEIIVLDTNRWYHKTLIVSEGISITIGAEYD